MPRTNSQITHKKCNEKREGRERGREKREREREKREGEREKGGRERLITVR